MICQRFSLKLGDKISRREGVGVITSFELAGPLEKEKNCKGSKSTSNIVSCYLLRSIWLGHDFTSPKLSQVNDPKRSVSISLVTTLWHWSRHPGC